MRQAGRQDYDPAKTPAQYGFSASNPTAVQQGPTIFLFPATQFDYPLAGVSLDVVQFMPDYTKTATEGVANSGLAYTDFFLEFAPDYIFWQSVVSANKLCFRFVARKEGNTGEPEDAAQAALSALIEWDNSLSRSTTSPSDQSAPSSRQTKMQAPEPQ